ncbi:adenosine receptor A1-like [Dendronephthya gigantea]|uniref:adenosine receptor A1-like n=1 Tax=Dendronephthya gigantea TaxID=151771 RepID=UPI0010697C03|nr:adenosine receptor A1-like [Dendronephthya gigantea]XP_028418259.1 adenosine receptor A1-like [Dendronephthya gigantea]
MTNSSDVLDHESSADRIVVGLLCVIGIFLNTATLIVMVKNFTRIFGRAESCFVTNLCVADLATCVSGLLWTIFPISKYPSSLVIVLHCLQWATVSASFLTLSCMAIERLLVVVNPIKARRMLKRPFVSVCCAVVWVISIVPASMIAVNAQIAQCIMVVMFESCLIITIGCYIRVYFIVKKLNREGFHTTARYNVKDSKLKVEESEPALHHRVAVRQESRITNLVFLLVVILAVTVLPYMVLLQVVIAHSLSCHLSKCPWSSSMEIALDILFPIEMLNFVINPVIYAWRLAKFRQASKRSFKQFICCKKLSVDSDGMRRDDCSYSNSSDSMANSPATIFTGGNPRSEMLNNNRHS